MPVLAKHSLNFLQSLSLMDRTFLNGILFAFLLVITCVVEGPLGGEPGSFTPLLAIESQAPPPPRRLWESPTWADHIFLWAIPCAFRRFNSCCCEISQDYKLLEVRNGVLALGTPAVLSTSPCERNEHLLKVINKFHPSNLPHYLLSESLHCTRQEHTERCTTVCASAKTEQAWPEG